MRAAQTELQIEHERIRRQVIAPLQESPRKLQAALTRTSHHDDFMPRQVAEPSLDAAGILLPSPVCLSASNRKQMKNDIKFYNQPGADREDWYRLVIPDDEADPFIEHTWTYHNADGSMEMNSGRACIPISDFLSKEYPKEAKTHFRKLLATMAPGETYPGSEPE